MASVISMKALLESGVHFGHRTNKWNPKMKPFIFTERNGIHIIDLQQTVKAINHAFVLIRDTVMEGGTIMFVGTKRQAQETVHDEAIRCGMPYVTERWLGGMLTNWFTINQRLTELERLEKLRDSGEIHRLTKKEGLLIERNIRRLEIRLGGVREMKNLPDLLFVVDINREATAIHEANVKKIPVIAMVDTNCDPGTIDYVIPSNDDAIRAIKLLVGKAADAVLEGKAMRKEEEEIEARISEDASDAEKGPRLSQELDLDDADLLGEATLAKLSSQKDATETESTDEAESVVEEAAESIEAPEVEEVVEAVEAVAEVVAESAEVPAVEEVVEEVEAVAEVVVESAEAHAVEEVVEEVEAVAEVVVESAEAPVVEEVAPAAPVEPDKLAKIEGIGPKVASVLDAAGIQTFAQLAGTDVGKLEEILAANKLQMMKPGSWPQQAKLAADGKWDELQKLQDGLSGGK
jgi:small subunit ribosomal protein S2